MDPTLHKFIQVNKFLYPNVGADVNYCSQSTVQGTKLKGQSPLIKAIVDGDLNIVDMLLSAKGKCQPENYVVVILKLCKHTYM